MDGQIDNHLEASDLLLHGRTSGEFDLSNPLQFARTFLHVMQGLRMRLSSSPTVTPPKSDAYAELRKEMELAADMLIDGMRFHHSHMH